MVTVLQEATNHSLVIVFHVEKDVEDVMKMDAQPA
jgi:hypothetical protein